MKGKIISAIVALVLVILVVGYLINISSSKSASTTTSNRQATVTAAAGTGTNAQSSIKLSDTSFANNAYLISGDNLDANAKAALSGFDLQKTTNNDGSMIITLKALNPEYQDQTYTVQPGQSLYFIERTMGDDSPPNGENNLGDDKAVLVDANGYIIG